MPKDDTVLTAQPSFKNYVRHWLICAASLALAVAACVYGRAVVGDRPTVIAYTAVVLCAVAVVVFIVVVWKRASLTLCVHEDRVVIERGILAKNMKELFITDIRTIDINQSIFQRIMGTGDLAISTPGVSQTKDVLQGFPDPARIKDTIIHLRQKKQQQAKVQAAPPKPQAPEAPPEPQPPQAGGKK